MAAMNLVQSPSRHRPAVRGIAGLSEAVVDLRRFATTFAPSEAACQPASWPWSRRTPSATAPYRWLVRPSRPARPGSASPAPTKHCNCEPPVDRADPHLAADAAELMLLGDVDVDVSVSTIAELQRVVSNLSVHHVQLKLDTGLHRSGSAPDQWIGAHLSRRTLRSPRRSHGPRHLVAPSHGDSPDAVQSCRQPQLLRTGVILARRAGSGSKRRPFGQLAGAITLDAPDLDLVRIGAGLYGIDEIGTGLRPAMRLMSKLAQVRRIRAGEGVSYGHDFVADRDTTVALVPLGYADGIPRTPPDRPACCAAGSGCP